MTAKSYWQQCSVTGENQTAIRGWFVGMADDMHITKAEILCDAKTDKEKKLRIFARKDQRDYILTRTNRKTFSITCRVVI